jgi:hypothetical protein
VKFLETTWQQKCGEDLKLTRRGAAEYELGIVAKLMAKRLVNIIFATSDSFVRTGDEDFRNAKYRVGKNPVIEELKGELSLPLA